MSAPTVVQLMAAKDGAYAERNKLAASVAKLVARLPGWSVGVGLHDGRDWEDDWRTVLFIDTPVGQLSWHFHDSERHLLDGLPAYEGKWDGHSTEEKYRRLLEAVALGWPKPT